MVDDAVVLDDDIICVSAATFHCGEVRSAIVREDSGTRMVATRFILVVGVGENVNTYKTIGASSMWVGLMRGGCEDRKYSGRCLALPSAKSR